METVPRLKRSRFGLEKGQGAMLAMLLPFLIFFFIFTILPILSSVLMSFTSFDMISLPKLSGIDNYRRMFVDDAVFPAVVKNTLVFAIIAGPLGFLLSFLLAWFVNEFSPAIRTLLSFLFYAPSLVGNAYFIWKVAFSGDSYGYINSLLLSIGIMAWAFYVDPQDVPPLPLLVVLFGIPAGCIIGTLKVLVDRLKEIGKGEEDAYRNY